MKMFRVVSIALLIGTSNGMWSTGTGLPSVRWDTSSYRDLESGGFLTNLVSTDEDCVTACRRWTSCVAVNYRRLAHLCSLVHHAGDGDFAVTIAKKRRGIVSWEKPKSEQFTVASDNGACSNCTRMQSCKFNPETGTCTIAACGKPTRGGPSDVKGNMYTIGSKTLYNCYDYAVRDIRPRSIECSAGGIWDEKGFGCAYKKYELHGQTIIVRLAETATKMKKAEADFRADGASLPSVLTLERRKAFTAISNTETDDRSVKYWIDGHRRGIGLFQWFTAGGLKYGHSTQLWKNILMNVNRRCIILEYKVDWRNTSTHGGNASGTPRPFP